MVIAAKHQVLLEKLELFTLAGVNRYRGELVRDHKGRRDFFCIKTSTDDGRALVLFLKRSWKTYKKERLASVFRWAACWSILRWGWENSKLRAAAGPKIAVILGFLFLIVATGCNKGPYRFVTVLDHSVFDDQLYVLLLLEEGVNKAYRYAPHGDAFEAKRQVVAITRCSLSEKGTPSLELVAQCEYRFGAILKNYELSLAATNACVVARDDTFEAIFPGSPQNAGRLQRLVAAHTVFGAGRRLLIGCGEEPWALDTRSFTIVSNANVSETLRIICGGISTGNSVAASGDLGIVAFQNALAGEPGMTVIGRGRTNQLRLPDATFRLKSVHERDGSGIAVFTSLDANGSNVAVVLDLDGRVLAKSSMTGELASDALGTTVVSIVPMAATRSSAADPISGKVWKPKEQREYVFSLDTATILSALKFSK